MGTHQERERESAIMDLVRWEGVEGKDLSSQGKQREFHEFTGFWGREASGVPHHVELAYRARIPIDSEVRILGCLVVLNLEVEVG